MVKHIIKENPPTTDAEGGDVSGVLSRRNEMKTGYI
jgi:hypothetical protein